MQGSHNFKDFSKVNSGHTPVPPKFNNKEGTR